MNLDSSIAPWQAAVGIAALMICFVFLHHRLKLFFDLRRLREIQKFQKFQRERESIKLKVAIERHFQRKCKQRKIHEAVVRAFREAPRE